MKTAFVITIDTEGDNVWARGAAVGTENAKYLPRFQSLCHRFGFKPTYVVNYEMVTDRSFQEFGRSVLRDGAGEMGLHVHPWASPPHDPADDGQGHLYLYELSDGMLRAKLEHVTNLLVEAFGVRPVSHRAGRWGFDERVARTLVDLGYLVDCSVAPGASYTAYKGRPDGNGGPDFFGFPTRPYFLDLGDIRRSGTSPLLEVPVSTKQNYPGVLDRFHHSVRDGVWGKALRKLAGPPQTWLRPSGRNLDAMLALVDWALEGGAPVLEFMLHSSEFMPGGSPTFVTAADVEVLYEDLERLFAHIARRGAVGVTLSEFRDRFVATSESAPDAG